MKYAPEFFRDGLPDWKRKKDPILSRVFYRPVSFYLSSFFCEIGWTANMISFLSAFVALIACACFIFSRQMLGALLINLWLILDCADGNIARCVAKEKYGSFADAMSSYICVGLMFVTIGYSVYNNGGLFFSAGAPEVILIGGLAGSFDSLARLLFQKFLNSSYKEGVLVDNDEDPSNHTGFSRVRVLLDANMSLGGILPIATLCGTVFRALDVVLCIWCVYYGLVFLGSLIYLIHKVLVINEKID